MREIKVDLITKKVAEALVKANKVLPDDVYQALNKAIKTESSELSRRVIKNSLKC